MRIRFPQITSIARCVFHRVASFHSLPIFVNLEKIAVLFSVSQSSVFALGNYYKNNANGDGDGDGDNVADEIIGQYKTAANRKNDYLKLCP